MGNLAAMIESWNSKNENHNSLQWHHKNNEDVWEKNVALKIKKVKPIMQTLIFAAIVLF